MSWTIEFADAWVELTGVPATAHRGTPPYVDVETAAGEKGRVDYLGGGATLFPEQGSEQELWDTASPVRCAALVAALLAS